MPVYNVKGKTTVKWDKQVQARNEEDAEEKACEEAEYELENVVESEVDDVCEVSSGERD